METIAILGAEASAVQQLAAALQAHVQPGRAQVLAGVQRLAGLPAASHILLIGLEPPHATPSAQRADAALRQCLLAAQRPFRVLYGDAAQHLGHALQSLAQHPSALLADSALAWLQRQAAPRATRLRAWACEDCSDPDCEHRLFTALRTRSAAAA